MGDNILYPPNYQSLSSSVIGDVVDRSILTSHVAFAQMPPVLFDGAYACSDDNSTSAPAEKTPDLKRAPPTKSVPKPQATMSFEVVELLRQAVTA
ncbi:hypothetical protein PRNP1_005816 [Phytophthora ramorum]